MSRTIAILGGGYSGALTAVQLLRQCRWPGTRVLLIEREPPVARGLAYRSWDESQLLNVPAGNMSALAQEPGHFTHYCKEVDPALHAGSFVSRRIYGDYLEDTLREAQGHASAKLEICVDEALGVHRAASGGFEIHLASGERRPADQVVLAFGHFLPGDALPTLRSRLGERYLPNPWDIAALDRCEHGRPIVLIGCGHTAIDVLLRLASRGDARDILLISRHGLLPHGHRATPHAPHLTQFPPYLREAYESGSLRALLRAIRSQARRRTESGGDWRDVLNEIRPHIPTLWGRLPVSERRRFLLRVVPYWDVHRHRLAPSVALRLERMRQSGQVQMLAARLLDCAARSDAVQLTVRERHSGAVRELLAGTVINCTGPTYDLDRVALPLVAQLRSAGLLRPDPLRLGMDVDARYQVLDREGRSVPNLYYIGPMLKATFWEAIAVPELRGHAQCLAEILLDTKL